MNLLNTILGAKTPSVVVPTTATAAPVTSVTVPIGILPPEAKAELFEAVPPPRKTPPMPKTPKKLVIQDVPDEKPAPVEPVKLLDVEPKPDREAWSKAAAEVAEAPKRGRGRPPGAKNKPKAEPGTPEYAKEHSVFLEDPALEVTSITVTRGATVQVVQFEPMRIEVTATANVRGLTVAAAVQELDSQVLAEVVRRMQEMQAAKVGK